MTKDNASEVCSLDITADYRLTSKSILPHHRLDRLGRPLIILGVTFFVVVVFDITFYLEIDELSDGHTCIDTYWMYT